LAKTYSKILDLPDAFLFPFIYSYCHVTKFSLLDFGTKGAGGWFHSYKRERRGLRDRVSILFVCSLSAHQHAA
jgi:hypothetical protein